MHAELSLLFVNLSIDLIISKSAFFKIGWFNSNLRLVFSSGLEKIFGRAPKLIPRDITISSLIGSIGGLVTCAKHCLKYEYKSLDLSDNTDIGVSEPIEPIGSIPVWIIG